MSSLKLNKWLVQFQNKANGKEPSPVASPMLPQRRVQLVRDGSYWGGISY